VKSHHSNINIVYTSLKSTFTAWATICRRHYGSIVIRLVVAASQNRENTQNSDKI